MEVRVGTAELFDFLIGAGALGGRFSDAVDIAVSFVKEKKIDSEVQISAETEKNVRLEVSRVVLKIKQKWKHHRRTEARFRSNEESFLAGQWELICLMATLIKFGCSLGVPTYY